MTEETDTDGVPTIQRSVSIPEKSRPQQSGADTTGVQLELDPEAVRNEAERYIHDADGETVAERIATAYAEYDQHRNSFSQQLDTLSQRISKLDRECTDLQESADLLRDANGDGDSDTEKRFSRIRAGGMLLERLETAELRNETADSLEGRIEDLTEVRETLVEERTSYRRAHAKADAVVAELERRHEEENTPQPAVNHSGPVGPVSGRTMSDADLDYLAEQLDRTGEE